MGDTNQRTVIQQEDTYRAGLESSTGLRAQFMLTPGLENDSSLQSGDIAATIRNQDAYCYSLPLLPYLTDDQIAT
jgi:hypothetical protein